jgi:hypothetical protein
MTRKRVVSPTVGAILVIVLVVLRLVLAAVLPPAQAQVAKFMTVFLAILFAFIFFGVYLASVVFGGRVSKRVFVIVEIIIIAGILIGALGMFQPWHHIGYSLRFNLLPASTLAFTVWSHVTQECTSVSSRLDCHLGVDVKSTVPKP